MIPTRYGLYSIALLPFFYGPGSVSPEATDPEELTTEPTLRIVRPAAEAAFGIGVCPTGIDVELWPPNHKPVDIDLQEVLGPNTQGIVITSITQDEPVEGLGDGNTVCDGSGIGTSIAHIRSERSGRENGRVYEITYSAFAGGCEGFVTVSVPHDQSGRLAIDDGQTFDSTEGCP